MGTLRIMGQRGDEPFSWDPEDPASVEEARKVFEERKKAGYRIYRVERKPQRTGDPVTEFDPTAGEYLFAMPMRGGCA